MAIHLSFALEKQGLFCPFPVEYVPVGVRGIGNTMTSVTVKGFSLSLGPGRCSQGTLSLMCTSVTSSNISVRSCKLHSCNDRQCLSFMWLPQTSLASVSTASYQEAISPRACSLGQDFFPKHLRLPFPTKGYTCNHPWNTSDLPSEGNAVANGWLADMSYSNLFMKFMSITASLGSPFSGHLQKLSMWSQWSPSHCVFSLEVAPVPNYNGR